MVRKVKRVQKSAGIRPANDGVPAAELDVLACVWREGPVTARRIREMMKRYRPMAHGSVVTLLTRLEKKGHIAKDKGPVGKAFLFRARSSPDATYRRLTRELLDRVFAGNVAMFIKTALESEPPTVEEYAEIQQHMLSIKSRLRKKARD